LFLARTSGRFAGWCGFRFGTKRNRKEFCSRADEGTAELGAFDVRKRTKGKSLEERLVQQRQRWIEEAKKLMPGGKRDDILAKVHQCDVAIKQWGSSPELI
jgi:hypothetical protein